MKKKDVMTGSEAIYGFCAWLTTRKAKTVMSSADDCAGIARLVAKFVITNHLPPPRDNWTDYLKHPRG